MKIILLIIPLTIFTAKVSALTNQEIYIGYKAIGHLGYCVKAFHDNGDYYKSSRIEGYKTVLEVKMPKAVNQHQRELTAKWTVKGSTNGYNQGLQGCISAYNETFEQ